MKLVYATQEEQIKSVEELYLSAFPKEERIPFSLILQKQAEGLTEIYTIQDEDGAFGGLAIMALYEDMALLNFFAVSPDRSGGGIGSAVLQMLKDRYQDRRFFLEVESTAVPADNMRQRLERKEFYYRNGMSDAPLMVRLMGVEMDIMVNACSLTFEEYYDLYAGVMGGNVGDKVQLIR